MSFLIFGPISINIQDTLHTSHINYMFYTYISNKIVQHCHTYRIVITLIHMTITARLLSVRRP